MKYDPTTKQSMARWGRKSKNNVELPIMEEKQYGKNPF